MSKPHKSEPIKSLQAGKLYLNIDLTALRAGEYALSEDLGFLRGDAQVHMSPFTPSALAEAAENINKMAAALGKEIKNPIELTMGCIKLPKGSLERLFKNRRWYREMAWRRQLNTTMRRYRRKQWGRIQASRAVWRNRLGLRLTGLVTACRATEAGLGATEGRWASFLNLKYSNGGGIHG